MHVSERRLLNISITAEPRALCLQGGPKK